MGPICIEDGAFRLAVANTKLEKEISHGVYLDVASSFVANEKTVTTKSTTRANTNYHHYHPTDELLTLT